MTPTPKETYDYCEYLIDLQLNKTLKELSKWEDEDDAFVDSLKKEIKDIYKHLDNIQAMKTSYLSGR